MLGYLEAHSQIKFSIERHQTLPGSNRKAEISAVSEVQVVDEHTVKFVLSAPFAPLLALMARAVARIFVSRNSELSLAFADGSAIHVAPDPLSEAWELEGLGKLMLICPPGGGSPITFE